MAAYLDHAASTPPRPEAVDAMLPHLREGYGNPSGSHTMARAARKAIDEAREVVAEALGAQPGEVVFTSGGTEADNLAVFGVLDQRVAVGGPTVVVSSAIEHHAVLDPVLARGGRLVAVDARGVLDLAALEAALDADVALVSIMAVNNEVGSIQPLAEAVELVRRMAPSAVIHSDAVQAVQWLDLSATASAVDLISISGHKFGGPKGAGALVVRDGTALSPRSLGGGQERERRSGTQNVAGIVGLGEALRSTLSTRSEVVERVGKLRDRLLDGLLASVPDLVVTAAPMGGPSGADGGRDHLVPGIAHVCIPGVDSESLLFLLEKSEVYASAASSCASGAAEPSHVLAAMGVDAEAAGAPLRLSLGWASTDADVDAALAAVPPAVERLRLFS
jgi:cysteine desulfurase